MQNIKRWISLALVVCLLAMLPAAALAEDTETGTGLPVEGEIVTSPSPSASAAEESETATSPSPSASAAAESETVTSPRPSASAAAEGESITSPSPSIEASVSPVPRRKPAPRRWKRPQRPSHPSRRSPRSCSRRRGRLKPTSVCPSLWTCSSQAARRAKWRSRGSARRGTTRTRKREGSLPLRPSCRKATRSRRRYRRSRKEGKKICCWFRCKKWWRAALAWPIG